MLPHALIYFAAGCLFTLIIICCGVGLSFFIASKIMELKLDKFEYKEKERRATQDPVEIRPVRSGAGPVKQMSPAKVKYDEEKGFNDALKDVIN